MGTNLAGGLREGHDGEHVVFFVLGSRPIDLTNYTVTCSASFDGGATEHTPTVSAYQLANGGVKVSHTAAQLDQAGDLACEFDFAPLNGAAPLNPNARPVTVSVRPKYSEAS